MMVNILLFCYIFVCISLIVFNVFYVLETQFLRKKMKKETQKWQKDIEKQVQYLKDYQRISRKHQKHLRKKLKFVLQLLAYTNALDTFERETIIDYLKQTHMIWRELAVDYLKKNNMKKAYFAYVVSKHAVDCQNEYRPILHTLILYLKDSTIYCHENVLKALCKLGNIQSIENALSIFNSEQWFHHRKLIADNLIHFQGDKNELMKVLWNHINDWNDNMMSAIVEFISRCHGAYEVEFLQYLHTSTTPLEVRLAIIRYFHTCTYEPVRNVLYSFLDKDMKEDEKLTIVAAFALDRYPGEKTVILLKNALHHHNWYVRYNAASSLKNLNVPYEELEDILNGQDNYARDILTYIYSRQEDI